MCLVNKKRISPVGLGRLMVKLYPEDKNGIKGREYFMVCNGELKTMHVPSNIWIY
jgi:hypothetical protein